MRPPRLVDGIEKGSGVGVYNPAAGHGDPHDLVGRHAGFPEGLGDCPENSREQGRIVGLRIQFFRTAIPHPPQKASQGTDDPIRLNDGKDDGIAIFGIQGK